MTISHMWLVAIVLDNADLNGRNQPSRNVKLIQTF